MSIILESLGFKCSNGSVVGRDHILAGRPNQDACRMIRSDKCLVAVVCDGCSDGLHNEVGAQLGANLIAKALYDQLQHYGYSLPNSESKESYVFWEHIRQDVLTTLRVAVRGMGGSFSWTVGNYFLFTVMGAVITQSNTIVFSLGDGLYAVNGEPTRIGPFPGNAPPYLAYGGLVESSLADTSPRLLKFQIQCWTDTSNLQSLLIGSDGLVDFMEAKDKKLPGKQEMLGDLSQFWTEGKYFKNPDMVRRRLALANRECTIPDWENKRLVREAGLLPDDTTLVAIRRKEE